MNQDFIRDRIKEQMHKAGIKQSTLAHSLGISQSSVSDILNGYTRLSLDMLSMIATAIGVNEWELLPPPPEYTGK